MDAKKIFTSIGVCALFLGVGMNTHFAINDHGIKEASLSQFVEGQSSSSNELRCTGRGGKEQPKEVLLMKQCVKAVTGAEISLSAATSMLKASGSISAEFEASVILGNHCVCSKRPKNYAGVLGCDYTWESPCQ